MAHKENQRQNTIDEIKTHARQQLKSDGVGGISLSAIARSMEISPPALYRYFDSKDDLVKALISDSIDDLINTLEKAAGTAGDDYGQQFWAAVLEYREWALAHPSDFQMLFNAPVSNDQAIQFAIQEGIQRVFLVFLWILRAAYRNGTLRHLPEDSKVLKDIDFGTLPFIEAIDISIPRPVLYSGLVAWSRLQGLLNLEFALGFSNIGNAQDSIYRHEAAGVLQYIGLDLTQPRFHLAALQGRPIQPRILSRPTDDLHVIFGSGPLGLAVMRELVARGKRVRMINRTGNAEVPEGVELMVGDAFQPEFTRKACQNAGVIYQCAQPARGIWLDRFETLNAAILDGAAAKGARFIYGDDLLVYGMVEGIVHEGLANKPASRKGQVRARVAEAVLTAHRSGRVRAAIGRASDFFGPYVLDAILGERYFASLIRGKTVSILGNAEIPHSFTFIEDFGKALVELGESDDALGQTWHVPNLPALPQRQLLELFSEEAGVQPKFRSASRRGLGFQAIFSKEDRDKSEVFYQFEKPFIVDSSKFENTFHVRPTPLPEAVHKTVQWFREYL